MELEVENKGKPSFPSNYVTIHQLRQRWLQQQQQSSSSSPSFSLPTVIPESNHRDEDHVVVEPSSATASQKPQNHTVSGRSPLPLPPVTKSPSSFNTKNKASSTPPFSPILSGGSKKKPQNDAVSLTPPAKTKSSPPLISKQNHHYEIISKTLNESRFEKGRGPNRRLTPQKPETEPETEPIDGVEATTTTTTLDIDSANDVTDQPISNNQLSKKKKRVKKKKKPKRVSPDQSLTGAGSLPETDPKPETEVEAVVVVDEKEQESGELGGRRKPNKKAVRESKMGQELEEAAAVAVVEKKQQQKRETRGRRNWDKKGVREFKDKTAAFDRNKHGVGENAVEPEAEPELEVEMEVETVVVEKGQASGELGGRRKSNKKAERESKVAPEPEEVAVVVVEKKQKPRESRGRRDWDKKGVWEYKPKTVSFGQYDYNSNVANNVDVVGGGDVVKDVVVVNKVVGNGDVVKENPKPGSGNLDHQGQGQGKQSLKSASIDNDLDMSETAVKEIDAVNNNNNYNYNRNATGNGGRNWRMGYGRFRGQGIQRPMHSKPLIATRKGEVWVKKGESNTTYHLGRVPIATEDKADS